MYHNKNEVMLYYLDDYVTQSDANVAFLFSTDKEISNHKHYDFYEISLVIRGSYINEYAGKTIQLLQNSLTFYKKGTSHSLGELTENSVHFTFIIREDYFKKEFCNFFSDVSLDQWESFRSVYLTENEKTYLADLANKLSNNVNIKYRQQLAKLYLYTALVFLQTTQSKHVYAKHMEYYASELLDRMNRYEYVAQTVTNICRDFPINASSLGASFQKLTGRTIGQYLNEKKADYAAQLLITTDYSIMEIALMVNINSPSHFSKFFQRHYGVTPKKYRQFQESNSQRIR